MCFPTTVNICTDKTGVDFLFADVLKLPKRPVKKKTKPQKASAKKEMLITKQDLQQINEKIKTVERRMEESSKEMGMQTKVSSYT